MDCSLPCICKNLTLNSWRDSLLLIWCWEDGVNPSLPRNCKR